MVNFFYSFILQRLFRHLFHTLFYSFALFIYFLENLKLISLQEILQPGSIFDKTAKRRDY